MLVQIGYRLPVAVEDAKGQRCGAAEAKRRRPEARHIALGGDAGWARAFGHFAAVPRCTPARTRRNDTVSESDPDQTRDRRNGCNDKRKEHEADDRTALSDGAAHACTIP